MINIRRLIIGILLSIVSVSTLKADIAQKFNDLLIEKYDFSLSNYPYYESRNDIGLFFDFAYDKKEKKIIIKRDQNNFPVVRFSLFEKAINPGDIVISLDKRDLSKLSDNQIQKLIKKTKKVNIELLNNKSFDLESLPYKFDNIKLANFDLEYINTIDTTKGVLEISFFSTFLNERPDLDIYAKNLLDDRLIPILDNLYYKTGFNLPIENLSYEEYKIDVDIRTKDRAHISFDNGSTRTLMDDYGIGQFRQKFDFSQFPFDEQTLKIKILTNRISTSDPNINWPKGNASVFFVTPDIGAFIGLEKYKQKNILKELGWSIVSTNILSDVITIKDYFDPYLNKTYDKYESSIDLIIEIKRNSAHYLFKIIVPVFLILCVAWSVLWIPTYKLDARLTTSIVSLLALIAYNFVFEGDIPKLDYLTDLDKFILLSYIFCCLPTFMSIGFSRFILRTKKLQNKVTIINSYIRRWGGVLYLLLTFQIFYQ